MSENPLLVLAEHAASWRTRPLPEAVAHHARRALIDWFAGQPSPLRHAALLNAAASHTVEFDDIFRDAGYHPGCPTIAPALAAVQQQGGTMEDLLRAITAGYEVSCRIGMAGEPSPHKKLDTTRPRGALGRGGAPPHAPGRHAGK